METAPTKNWSLGFPNWLLMDWINPEGEQISIGGDNDFSICLLNPKCNSRLLTYWLQLSQAWKMRWQIG